MEAVQRYLTLRDGSIRGPIGYARFLGDLRWAPGEDAVLYDDGEVLVFSEEIAQFIEGFVAGRELIHFGHLLHLLELLRGSRRTMTLGGARLKQVFAQTGRSLRNAGAFCAALCHHVPSVAEKVNVRRILDRLRHPGQPFSSFLVSSNLPSYEAAPLPPVDFEVQVLRALQNYTDEELTVWFRHGRGPVKEAGQSLARAMEPPLPRTLAGALATLLERPRLAGARPFIAQLVSSLALPPRRLAHQEIPIGGYADVTTQGRPDQILPSQFALDEWDFFRRFAERELLYFRREEPHARTRQDLVVLLDQGVRTWGDVRLVLAAAVLALGKQADRRGQSFLLAATSREGEIVDPLRVDAETLGQLVDASDLSANPGLALEHVLEEPAEEGRDLVLLTHPRNLREEDVTAAARRVTPGTRLFAVALDGSGAVELSELRRGVPVKVRQFQVDWAVLSPPTEMTPGTTAGTTAAWRGDVEPIGFPFRFGIGTPIQKGLTEFDLAGEWLLTVSRGGILHAWKVDGSGMEILPRGMWKGRLLDRIEAVLGVAGGFVVGGRVGNHLVAVHYDLGRRTCAVRPLGEALARTWAWRYSRERHMVVVGSEGDASARYGVDLHSGNLLQGILEGRASTSNPAGTPLKMPGRRLRIANALTRHAVEDLGPFLNLDPDQGRLYVGHLGEIPWKPFTPLADGRPVLRGCIATEAHCCGRTLAVKTVQLGQHRGQSLRLFRGPEGIPLAEYSLATQGDDFVLSPDGRWLAHQGGDARMIVHEVAGGKAPVRLTRRGGFSQAYHFLLGEGWLLLTSGKRHHYLFRWDRAALEIRQGAIAESFLRQEIGLPAGRTAGVPATGHRLPDMVRYDLQRFILKAENRLIAVGDRFGQVPVLDQDGRLVCMFFAFRGQVAAWMSDGTCHGPASLTGSPPTPGALEKIAAALRQGAVVGEGRP
jgi:hypothetical protein